MTNYLKYMGTKANHAVGVTVAGNNPENPAAGSTSQIVHAGAGQIVALNPSVASAVLDKEPGLWLAVDGFDA